MVVWDMERGLALSVSLSFFVFFFWAETGKWQPVFANFAWFGVWPWFLLHLSFLVFSFGTGCTAFCLWLPVLIFQDLTMGGGHCGEGILKEGQQIRMGCQVHPLKISSVCVSGGFFVFILSVLKSGFAGGIEDAKNSNNFKRPQTLSIFAALAMI